MRSATTMGRRFELYDADGGHCGPYLTLYRAIRDGIRRMRGRRSCPAVHIRDRAKRVGQPGLLVGLVERHGTSIDVFIFGPTSNGPAPVPDRALYDAQFARKATRRKYAD